MAPTSGRTPLGWLDLGPGGAVDDGWSRLMAMNGGWLMVGGESMVGAENRSSRLMNVMSDDDMVGKWLCNDSCS